MCHELFNGDMYKFRSFYKPISYTFATLAILEPLGFKPDETNHSIYIQPHSIEQEMRYEDLSQGLKGGVYFGTASYIGDFSISDNKNVHYYVNNNY